MISNTLRKHLTLFFALCSFSSLFAQQSYNMGSSIGSTDSTGFLFDDGGPMGNYSSGQLGNTFTIDVGPGKTVRLQFLEFDTRGDLLNLNLLCLFDYIELYDTTPGLLNGTRYCGNSIPPVYTSTTGKIIVRFTSDLLGNGAGFKAFWSTANLQTPPTDVYCEAGGPSCSTPNNITLEQVSLGTTSFQSTGCQEVNGRAYSDFTDSIFPVTSLIPTPFQAQSAGGLLGIHQTDIYIDWDNDGTFDPVLEYIPAVTLLNNATALIIPPSGLSNGLKRMRIRVYDPLSELNLLGPCGTSVIGEVEDYSIFYQDLLNPPPTCVDSTFPQDGALGVCLNTTLRWPRINQATAYRINLWTNTDTILFDFVTADTSLDASSYLVPNTQYFWTITPTNNNGDAQFCDTLSFTTVLNLDPSVILNPGGQPLIACVNDPIDVVTNVVGGTGTLLQNLTGTATQFLNNLAPGLVSLTGTLAGVFDLVLNIVDDYGCSSTDSTTLTIIDEVKAGQLSIVGLNARCIGPPVQLKILQYQGAIAIQDSVPGTGWVTIPSSKINDSIFEISGEFPGQFNLRVRATGSSCIDTSGNRARLNLFQAPPRPTITLVGNDTLCPGDSALLITDYNHSVYWNTNPTVLNDTLVVKTSGFYKATYLGGNCPTETKPVRIYRSPNPTEIIQLAGSATACSNEAPTLFANLQPGEVILWSDGRTDRAIQPLANGIFRATITNADGCQAITNSINIQMRPVDVAPTISSNYSGLPCLGEPVRLSTNYGSGIKWSHGPINQEVTVYNPGSYRVTRTNVFGCKSTSAPFLLQFRPAPTKPVIQVEGPRNRCLGDSVTLTLNTSYPLQWNFTTDGNNQQVVYSQGGYFATFVDSNQCRVYSDTARITFFQFQPTPAIQIIGNPCFGDTIALVSSLKVGNLWNNGISANDTLWVAQSGAYHLTNIQNLVCKAFSDTVNISFVTPPPKPTITQVLDSLRCDVVADQYQWITEFGPLANSNRQSIKPGFTSNYQVVAFTQSGCSSPLSDRYYVGFTSIDERAAEWVKLYPNPFSNRLSIQSAADGSAFWISNTLGQRVAEGQLQQGINAIDLQIAPGIYLVQVETPGGTFSQRVVKQ
ncbi:MAG TPA: GEVED domain-containing protein [Luteibaculaceae bacterium]|nr:GEVED domain-containing protein [Luteibaculaceae bacterium]